MKNIETRFCSCNPIWFVFFTVFLLFIDIAASAQGDLLIFPKRLVFEGRNRVEKVTLSNIGKDSATYNISLIEYRMTEGGKFERISEPDEGQHFATPFLRFFPRRVDLAPGESQTVKVQLRNTEKMEVGEYRSHLYFRADKNDTPLGQDSEEKNTETISVKLEAVFGISIATIIRKGESNTVASISGIEYSNDEESNHFLNFNINRKGNRSTYGDITINYISGKNKMYEVAKVKGLGVYTPGNGRKVKMQLQKPDGINFTSGKFEVVYTENEKKKIIAESELEL